MQISNTTRPVLTGYQKQGPYESLIEKSKALCAEIKSKYPKINTHWLDLENNDDNEDLPCKIAIIETYAALRGAK